MVGNDHTTKRADPFIRAWRKAEADRRRHIKRELWRWRRKVSGDAPADWLQRQPFINNVLELVRRAWDALRAGEDCEIHLERLRGLEARADHLDSMQAHFDEASENKRATDEERAKRQAARAKGGSRPKDKRAIRQVTAELAANNPHASPADLWHLLPVAPRDDDLEVMIGNDLYLVSRSEGHVYQATLGHHCSRITRDTFIRHYARPALKGDRGK